MLSAEDPQFLEALSAAASIADAEFAYPPRSLHRDHAHSIAGEAVLRASRSYIPLRGRFLPWSNSHVRRALRDFLRVAENPGDKNKKKRFHAAPVPLTGSESIANSIPDTIPAELLSGLTQNQKAVVRGKYELRQSFGEIGKQLGVTRQAAHRTHKRAKNRLARRLTNPRVPADCLL